MIGSRIHRLRPRSHGCQTIALCRSCRRLRSFDLAFDLQRIHGRQKIAAFGSSYGVVRSFDLAFDLQRLHGRQKIAAFGSSYGVVRSFDLAFDLQHIHGRQKIAAFGSSYGVVRSFGGVAFGELSSPARQELP